MKVRRALVLGFLVACGGGAGEQAAVVVPAQPSATASSTTAATASAPPPAAIAPKPFRCEGAKAFDVGGRSYCAYADGDTWDASERRCVANGGHLVTLDSPNVSEGLHRALGSPVGAARAAWIGLELKTKGKADWKWVTGEPVKDASWNDGEPNNFGGSEACGEWLVVDGRWNDTRCNLEQPYLCQGKVACKTGKTFASGGIQYCLNTENRTYAEAKRACAADGGTLAVFKTSAENASMRDAMAARFAAKTMWIGLGDAVTEGQWQWTSGAPVRFTAWQRGEPNDYNGENCVELHADTWKWNDFDCAATLPSVCEGPLGGAGTVRK